MFKQVVFIVSLAALVCDTVLADGVATGLKSGDLITIGSPHPVS